MPVKAADRSPSAQGWWLLEEIGRIIAGDSRARTTAAAYTLRKNAVCGFSFRRNVSAIRNGDGFAVAAAGRLATNGHEQSDIECRILPIKRPVIRIQTSTAAAHALG